MMFMCVKKNKENVLVLQLNESHKDATVFKN